jgi:putative glutamine amidotransferase
VSSVWPKKKVQLAGQSLLRRLLGHRYIWVNALHNQAVDRLGRQLKVSAREESGIIQAIEHESQNFVVGVQWHPEYMPQIPIQRRIFERLVEEAQRIQKNREK